jgi:hypothetical protein
MADEHAARSSRAETQRNIRLIAEELARRTSKEELQAQARELKERAKEFARDKASDLRDQAREKAAETAGELKSAALSKLETTKEKAMASPKALAAVGALAGAGLGAVLGKMGERNHEEPWRGDRLSPAGGDGYPPLAADGSRTMGDRARDLGNRARDLKERLPSTGELADKARSTVESTDPLLLGAIAAGIGALAALLIPETDTERRALAKAHDKARGALDQGVQKAKETLTERVEDLRVSDVVDKLKGEEGSVSDAPSSPDRLH